MVPESRNNDAFVKLQNDCNDSNARFEQTAMFSAKHLATGKCMHPFRGSSRPADGTLVVIYSGCNEKRLQFKFE